MSVPIEEVKRMAELARLRFSEKGLERMAGELSAILEYIEQLKELDTSNVEPMSHVHEYDAVVRSDDAVERLSRKEALEGAPDTDGRFFRVPRVIDRD